MPGSLVGYDPCSLLGSLCGDPCFQSLPSPDTVTKHY